MLSGFFTKTKGEAQLASDLSIMSISIAQQNLAVLTLKDTTTTAPPAHNSLEVLTNVSDVNK